MKTLEEAILSIEDSVSGHYRHPFHESELRKNLEENVEFLKFNLETLLKAKRKEVKDSAMKNIRDIVLDTQPLEPRTSRLMDSEYTIKTCILDCETILMRLAESNPEEGDTMSVQDLNEEYSGKYLYFNGDESGAQYVLVKNIHKGKDGYFEVDGIMIKVDWQDNTVAVEDISNYSFTDFYYFDDEEEPFTKCSDLDRALKSQPMDTSLPSHVRSAEEVVGEVIEAFYWLLHESGSEAEELRELFKNTKPQHG